MPKSRKILKNQRKLIGIECNYTFRMKISSDFGQIMSVQVSSTFTSNRKIWPGIVGNERNKKDIERKKLDMRKNGKIWLVES